MTLIEELKWRGMLHDYTPETLNYLNKENNEKLTGYIGFDPTSDSLHIGSLVPILLLVHLQKAGHTPVALIGGATGMVGDPSGKSAERNLLDEDTLQKNIRGIEKQLSQFLNFTNTQLPNAAKLVNNYDWFKNFSFIDFIRDVGKHLTVNYMMSKDSVKKRLESDTGMSFTEFSYQLVQGYDFYYLHQHHNCTLQMGGSDQWGNIVTGLELIRRKNGKNAYAFTCPLITKADGGKFGKSENGNIWLDATKTSPYDFYQFWLRADVVDAEKWIKIFTFLPQHTITNLITNNKIKPEEKLLQKTLAAELTTFVHGTQALLAAVETTAKLYGNTNADINSLSATDLETLEGIKLITIPLSDVQQNPDVVSFLTNTSIFESKGEAKKMIANNGLQINRKKVENVHCIIDSTYLLHNQYILIQKGKKHHYLIKTS